MPRTRKRLRNDQSSETEINSTPTRRFGSDVTAAVLHVLNRGKGNVRWLGIGPMSNLATLLKKNNTVAKRLHVVQMGGAIKYRKPGVAEHNFRMDPSAVAYVFPQLVRPELVLSDATFRPEIEITQQSELFQKLATTEEPWVQLLVAHCQQFFARHHPGTMMHDPLALTVAVELPFAQGGFGRIQVDNDGLLTVLETVPFQLRSEDAEVKGTEASYTTSAMYGHFMNWLETALLS